jgi:hypothetical protein
MKANVRNKKKKKRRAQPQTRRVTSTPILTGSGLVAVESETPVEAVNVGVSTRPAYIVHTIRLPSHRDCA